jgi:3-methylcrotonyl-CoA carboxylase alpha subunit
MFKKILVANRGEIARRIFYACRELGVRSVAVYSEADANAAWARDADESYPLAGVTAAETYLNQEAVLDVAQACGAEAIHPGYGFLSENPTFAEACARRDIVFIGPSPAAMRAMGSKAAAREVAVQAGVPVIPGVDGANLSPQELAAAAQEIGYPVLIKASAGGGGKGMRIVWLPEEFQDAVQAARGESLASFGSDHILLEKYFTEIHHVEVQVLGDQRGRILHLFERECSIQRRHQKIIEETPSPNVTPELRQGITAAAVALAEAVGYVSAGTIEFVVDPAGNFYLLEMNTRLQVEHPITELVTGLDIAAWQIRIAAGEPLPFVQAELRQRGHALECRLYAEDPANHFMPSIGTVAVYRAPAGPGVRVDDGIESGSQVTPYYDPMLAKVITWGADRPEAIRKMVRALREMILLGVTTNIAYLLDILESPVFQAGRTTTKFLEEQLPNWQPVTESDETAWLALAAYEALHGKAGATHRRAGGDAVAAQPDPWADTTGWRNAAPTGPVFSAG